MPITDDFSGLSNGADLSSATGWTKGASGSSIAGQISGDNNAGNMGIDYTQYAWDGSTHTAVSYYRDDGTFPDDQYAELVTLSDGTSNSGPAVRTGDYTSNGGDGYYTVVDYPGTVYTYSLIGGVDDSRIISDEAATVGANDAIRIDATGTTITQTVDGAQASTATSQTDHSEGNPGIIAYQSYGNGEWDDWECTDVAGGGGAGGIVTPRRSAIRNLLTR